MTRRGGRGRPNLTSEIDRLFDPILDTLPPQDNYTKDELVLPRFRCVVRHAPHRSFAVIFQLQHAEDGRLEPAGELLVPAEVWQQVLVPVLDRAHLDGHLTVTYAFD